ncbi:MAG: tetratricopeptide repeat protein [Patescibacteria group bacterium]|nr:tetratricopeptide repeat protein [Patescibacteria group bacterium]MDE2590414.1 tetratricopeptide repeat protein [Patescibacteria group bacterium]
MHIPKTRVTVFFIVVGFLCLVLLFATIHVYRLLQGPDTQCSFSHQTTSLLPKNPTTAKDFFVLGNYHYESGKCEDAVMDYENAITLDGTNARFYNNLGYTYMRLRNYTLALRDLDMAISLAPAYAQPYLNRGDLYNYYGPVIDRQKAIKDYMKAIALGAVHDSSVCGHLAMAQTNNLVPLALLKFIFNRGYCK